ncbi:MAG: pyridoxal-phosphate-dependent aminotransferase family protein [Sarcina sp.]
MDNEFLNFAVGPVMMDEDILEISAKQIPYFRTEEFSKINLENEKLLKKFVGATIDKNIENKFYIDKNNKDRVIFLTASGTAAMEATIINVFNEKDKILIVNGGDFGERFKKICEVYKLNYEEIKLNYGEQITVADLNKFKGKGFTSFLVNIHETSTGVLYNMDIISEFCKEENLLLVVDAISSFLADEINMKKSNIDALILSSQKALALPPGLSMVVLGERAMERVNKNEVRSFYFNFKEYLKDGERGQTPFTPAVGIILQLNKRLRDIDKIGVKVIIERTRNIALDFRERIVKLPFKISHENYSNTLTTIEPLGKITAYEVFSYLKDNHNIYICPNGGVLKDKIVRVGHIGNISIEDNKKLILVLNEMEERGLLI